MDLDDFSDDGLDELPDSELEQIEARAIQSTQAQPLQQSQLWLGSSQNEPFAASQYGWEEEDDLDTTEVTNDAGIPVHRRGADPLNRNTSGHKQAEPQAGRPTIPPVPNPLWNPAVDAVVRPLGILPSARHPIVPQVHPLSTSQAAAVSSSRPPASQFGRSLLPPQSQTGDVISALQTRVRALENELNASRGEASILRANALKAQREYDGQVSRLKKANAEQSATHARLVEAALAAEKSANTELQFMQRDMKEKEITERAKKRDGPVTAGTVTTPKKATARSWNVADGFDDMDIALSPSKGQGRGKASGSVAAHVGERTPSKGKRKRPVVDSPTLALETHTDDVVMSESKIDSPPPQPAIAQFPSAPPAAPFEFLPLVLDHGCFHQQPPTFDLLSRFAFPSQPNTSLAAMIFERIPLMGNPHRPLQLLVDFAEFIITLWTRCFEEQYWDPVKYLICLVSFTFQLHSTSVAPFVVASLVPIAQSTVFIRAEAIQGRAVDNGSFNKDGSKFVDGEFETTEAMSLLQVCSLACVTTLAEPDNGSEHSSLVFWRLISLEFVLLLLTPKQKLNDTISMLNLLATSPQPSSIGPISDDREPDFQAQIIIERVSAKLVEHPRGWTSLAQRRTLRGAALSTLIAFARQPYGATQLAKHANALPRIVTCLSTSIDELYDLTISPLSPRANSKASEFFSKEIKAAASLYQIISQCVLLIHTLVTDPHTSNVADMDGKLSLSHGGNKRYLLALGRLNFAEEDLVIEAGIDSGVLEAARELLELAVSPDEAEAINEAFEP